MILTRGHGPLSGDPAPGTFTGDGPTHRIFVERSAKRVRIELAGTFVADTTRAQQLHETGLLPGCHIPLDDVRRTC